MSDPVPVNLVMRAGVPYARRIRLTDGQNIWSTLDAFEVRAQVRASRNSDAPLRDDLGPYLTTGFINNDIYIDLSLTGSDTRKLKNGYYDVYISDVGVVDARAIRLLSGSISVSPAITTGEGF